LRALRGFIAMLRRLASMFAGQLGGLAVVLMVATGVVLGRVTMMACGVLVMVCRVVMVVTRGQAALA
jgi:hypothetical protein